MVGAVSSGMTQQLSYLNQSTSVKSTREGSASEEARETTAQELAETKSSNTGSRRIDTYA